MSWNPFQSQPQPAASDGTPRRAVDCLRLSVLRVRKNSAQPVLRSEGVHAQLQLPAVLDSERHGALEDAEGARGFDALHGSSPTLASQLRGDVRHRGVLLAAEEERGSGGQGV